MSATERLQEDTRWKLVDCVVPKEWLDRNGHMNMRHYFSLADDALAALPGRLGATAPRIDIRSAHMQYKKELFAGQAVEVRVQPLARRGEEIDLAVEAAAVGDTPIVAAECVIVGALLDADGAAIREFDRRISPPPPARDHPPSHPLPEDEDLWFVSDQGTARADESDATDRIGLRGHMYLFDRGGIGMFAELSRAENVFIPGSVGGFALSTRIEYRERMRAGERYKIRSRASAVGRKTVSFRHEMLRDGERNEAAAVCEHTMAFIDMTQRRSMPVPEKFKEILGKRYGARIP